MNCPKCNVTLELKNGEGHIGYLCIKCNGIWLPSKYLQSIRHAHNFEPNAFMEILKQSENNASNISCPGCSTHLHTSSLINADIEWCHTCNGVWFDKNELSSLITKYRELTKGEKISLAIVDILTAIGMVASL